MKGANIVTLQRKDIIMGCLFGGAAGDALGYPVEFDTYEQIQHQYGNTGIKFENFTGKPLISDDTQMTLFTASGLIDKSNYLENIWLNYQDWLETQFKPNKENMSHEPVSLLINNYPEIFASREPGGTCLRALMRGIRGTLEKPINDSKGCGGVMRVAPIGLLDDGFSDQQIIHLAAQSAALTHGHSLSTIASAFMADLIHQNVAGEKRLRQAIQNTRILIQETFCDYSEIFTFMEMLDSTLGFIDNDEEDLTNLKMIGEGWVAEETLMIAIYATLKYENDPEKAIEVAVNHRGDSDSTGALTGQIIGAFHGIQCLPQNFISKLELKDAIVEIGNRLV